MTTAHPVAFYLRDLSGDPVRRGGRSLLSGVDGASEIENQIADAHARGLIEGRAAAEALYEEKAKQHTDAFEERLAAAREAWSAEQGAHLGALIAAAFDDIERRISERVGNILQPIVRDEVRSRALAELSQTLRSMLAKGEYGKITISGPQDLLEAMEAQLSTLHEAVSLVVSDGPDVSVSADDTILETRIGAWGRALQGESS